MSASTAIAVTALAVAASSSGAATSTGCSSSMTAYEAQALLAMIGVVFSSGTIGGLVYYKWYAKGWSPMEDSVFAGLMIAVFTAVVLLLGVGLASLFSTAFGS